MDEEITHQDIDRSRHIGNQNLDKNKSWLIIERKIGVSFTESLTETKMK